MEMEPSVRGLVHAMIKDFMFCFHMGPFLYFLIAVNVYRQVLVVSLQNAYRMKHQLNYKNLLMSVDLEILLVFF